jgi:hypothetical protein
LVGRELTFERRFFAAIAIVMLGGGCRATPGTGPLAPAPLAAPRLNRVTRSELNARAVLFNQPLFWRDDASGDGALDPDELAVTWRPDGRSRSDFVTAEGGFTAALINVYQAMLGPVAPGGLSAPESARREAVRLELAQGRPTLIETEFANGAPWERTLAGHIVRTAALIERVYAKQKGTFGMDAAIPAGDTPSAALFFRNQGPFCVAAQTEKNPACNALPSLPKPVYGLYPAPLQSEPGFCATLQKQPNAAELLDHFGVVVAGGAPHTFSAVKYSVAFKPEMAQVASELDAAAVGLPDQEAALGRYLRAAAQAFRDDAWEPANEAWLAMGGGNSRYYLRVAPDEVYYEPCSSKAGFALTFGRINRESLAWQAMLQPIKQAMEDELAGMAGKPYQPRRVTFKLPDFIDIALYAGNERSPLGATAGQSLPNWGPVAEKGGRTMTMVNLYNDVDSQKTSLEEMASLYCKATMAKASADAKSFTMGVVLHEAGHNLGPAHDYKVDGRVDEVVFGGPLASTLEELKAQTVALYFPARLLAQRLVGARDVQEAQLREIAWALSNVAQGMYDSEGRAKNYSQLSAIQLGSFERAGVLEWNPTEPAANGTDQGCFAVRFDRWDGAAARLMQTVLSIKSRGDRAGAERLKAEFVDGGGDWKRQRDVIAERWLRTPRATFVYSINGL